jgi:hypothetical protein
MFDPVSKAHISATANWDGSREILRVPYQRFPGCETAHGNPSDIDPIQVDWIFLLDHK